MSEGYVCCFCGKDVTKEDYAAVQLIATNLWEREAAQAVYAHSQCAATQMAAGQLSPDVLLDSRSGYTAEEILLGENESSKIPGWACLTIILAIAAAIIATADLLRVVGL